MNLVSMLNDPTIKEMESDYEPTVILKESVKDARSKIYSVQQNQVDLKKAGIFEKITLNCGIMAPKIFKNHIFKLEFILNEPTQDDDGKIVLPGGILMLRLFVMSVGFSVHQADGSTDVSSDFQEDQLKNMEFFSNIVSKKQPTSDYFRYYVQNVSITGKDTLGPPSNAMTETKTSSNPTVDLENSLKESTKFLDDFEK